MTRLWPICIVCTACGAAADRPAAVSLAPTDDIETVVLGKQGRGTPAPAKPGTNVPAIKVNTVGYPRGWKKIAVFNVEPSGAVVKDASGKTVLALAATPSLGIDEASQDPVWQIDMSALDRPGRYTVATAGAESDPFVVQDDPYRTALIAGLKSFYFQRTRTALVEPYAIWNEVAYTRPEPSHTHEDVGWDLEHYPDKKHRWKMDAGWHDAGNYDMYVPSTAPSAQILLLAYELAPWRFGDEALNIPESGNGVPDILDETKWGLRWVLSMQEESGAFRHREAVMKWSPEGPAHEDKTVRWVAGVSTAATAKAVAVLEVAARVYRPFDAPFAARCDEAAQRGWDFLVKNPKRILVDGKGSAQPKWDDEPGHTATGALFIAAVERWHSRRDPVAKQQIETLLKEPETQSEKILSGAWANVSRWGLLRLARDDDAALRDEARKRLFAAVDAKRPQLEKDGYRCISTTADYYWAHNSNLLEKAHIMAEVARLSDEHSWALEAARDQWHWVLGRNPNAFSMVTGVGKGPTRFYHMEWGHKEPPPPGFLVGGPNADNLGFLAPGAPAKALLWDNPMPLRSGHPPHSLWHWQQSDLWDGGFVPEGEWTEGWWAVSEHDILYSANFVLVGAALAEEAVQ